MKEQRAPADIPQAVLELVFWIATAVLEVVYTPTGKRG